MSKNGVDRPDLKKRLPLIKTLAMMKMEKNFIALAKGYPTQPYLAFTPDIWIHRLEDELKELKKAWSKQDLTNIKEELADLSNIIDYFYEAVS